MVSMQATRGDYLYHIAECVKLPTPEEQTDYVSKVIKMGVE
ncbi:hypothetical protein LCGC14_2273000 [marine sediment metagenome]|uniref:Uncharacterized protein n=1 Tax=marine sediment metagenome TaxID=412755 RepID=A0A0F9CWC9_9ZZZZ